MQNILRAICSLSLMVAASGVLFAQTQLIGVTSPEYRSDVHGDTAIRVSAVGYRSPLQVKSWLPGGTYGSDSTVASVPLDADGLGSFQFSADHYPHGPITVRITGTRISDGHIDTCYLQLYNTGGSSFDTPARRRGDEISVSGRFQWPVVDLLHGGGSALWRA
jgi:hypothetical protein